MRRIDEISVEKWKLGKMVEGKFVLGDGREA
jgi:hypothetical protein